MTFLREKFFSDDGNLFNNQGPSNSRAMHWVFSQKLFKQISMLFVLLIYLVEKEHKNLYIIIFVHNENAVHLAITEKQIYTTKELEMIG